jgi:hypothetical protein
VAEERDAPQGHAGVGQGGFQAGQQLGVSLAIEDAAQDAPGRRCSEPPYAGARRGLAPRRGLYFIERSPRRNEIHRGCCQLEARVRLTGAPTISTSPTAERQRITTHEGSNSNRRMLNFGARGWA